MQHYKARIAVVAARIFRRETFNQFGAVVGTMGNSCFVFSFTGRTKHGGNCSARLSAARFKSVDSYWFNLEWSSLAGSADVSSAMSAKRETAFFWDLTG